MAVTSGFPGLIVEILVNGVPLQEYNDHEAPSSPTTTTKYIEAQSGAEFAIRYTVPNLTSSYRTFSVSIFLDGEIVTDAIHEPHRYIVNSPMLNTGRISMIGSQTVQQKYQFSEIAIIEGNIGRINEHLKEKVASYGNIRVAFRGATNVRSRHTTTRPLSMSSMEMVPEKALKGQAKTHRAVLTEARESPSATWHTSDAVGTGPFAIFNFQYRSLAALRALGVVPREPTPVPLEDRPEDELNAEELRQVVKRLKAREAVALEIKKEKADKRKRAISVGDESNPTDDFEVVEARDKRRRRGQVKDVIVLN